MSGVCTNSQGTAAVLKMLLAKFDQHSCMKLSVRFHFHLITFQKVYSTDIKTKVFMKMYCPQYIFMNTFVARGS